MFWFRIALLMIATLAVGIIGHGPDVAHDVDAQRFAARYAQTIVEDDAQWDCRTMGNHVCGSDLRQHERAHVPADCSLPADGPDVNGDRTVSVREACAGTS